MKSELPETTQAKRLGIVTCLAIALGFIIPTFCVYADTPSDPQKPIGYIFISAYGIVVGVLGGGGIAGLYHAIKQSISPIKYIYLIGSIIGILIAAFLFTSRFCTV